MYRGGCSDKNRNTRPLYMRAFEPRDLACLIYRESSYLKRTTPASVSTATILSKGGL